MNRINYEERFGLQQSIYDFCKTHSIYDFWVNIQFVEYISN